MGAEGMQRILRGFGSAEEMFEAGRDAAAALDRAAALDAHMRRRGAGLPTFEAYQRRRPSVMRQRRGGGGPRGSCLPWGRAPLGRPEV